MLLSEFIRKVKELSFPEGSYIVFGSGPLLAHGIRESNDIDFLVSEALYEKLKSSGWKEKILSDGETMLVNDLYEAGKRWKYANYNPTLSDLLKTAEVIEGVPFANLKEVVKWKRAFGREKDLKDIDLIEKYLSK